MKSIFISTLFICVLFTACSKDEEEAQDPIDTCNTESLSFQDDILSIFNSSCNGCHGADSSFGGITLDNYDGVKTVVDSGRLLGAINREEGFSPMPQSASKLPDCSINKIDSWISEGASNN